MDNAIRYAGSHVSIGVATDHRQLTIAVEDDGPGVPAAERERVFGRLARLNTSRQRGSGTTGLGLAIALEIARAHHGTITLGQSPCGGARVLIRLPAASAVTSHNGLLAPTSTRPAADHPSDNPR